MVVGRQTFGAGHGPRALTGGLDTPVPGHRHRGDETRTGLEGVRQADQGGRLGRVQLLAAAGGGFLAEGLQLCRRRSGLAVRAGQLVSQGGAVAVDDAAGGVDRRSMPKNTWIIPGTERARTPRRRPWEPSGARRADRRPQRCLLSANLWPTGGRAVQAPRSGLYPHDGISGPGRLLVAESPTVGWFGSGTMGVGVHRVRRAAHRRGAGLLLLWPALPAVKGFIVRDDVAAAISVTALHTHEAQREAWIDVTSARSARAPTRIM